MVGRPSTQATLDIGQLAIRKLEQQIRKRLEKAIQNKESVIERIATQSAQQLIRVIAKGQGSVKGVGSVSAKQSLRDSPLGRYVLSAQGIGELGIPDPDTALDVLVDSIPKATDVRVRVQRGRITITARFQPQRLIRLNPHPGRRFVNGQNISVDSWLQWTVGPRKQSGTPGFGLARVGQIFSHLTSRGSIDQSKIESIVQSSRTFRRAGAQAGLMLSVKPGGAGRKSAFEALTGDSGQTWTPLPFGNNFWTQWWKANSDAMKEGFRGIVGSIMKEVAAELEKG